MFLFFFSWENSINPSDLDKDMNGLTYTPLVENVYKWDKQLSVFLSVCVCVHLYRAWTEDKTSLFACHDPPHT